MTTALTATPTSLFTRLGGEDAIRLTVDAFYERVLQDASLAPFFTDTDLDWLKESQRRFFAQALGGPQAYTGRSMREAHEALHIDRGQFDGVAEHLAASLASLDVDETLIAAVIAAIAPLANEIINPESDPTGRYHENEETTMTATTTMPAPPSTTTDLASLQSALENVGTNIFMGDLDLNIIFVNEKSRTTLESIKHVIKDLYGVTPEELMGSCIDMFHKDPSYQRGILRNPRNLPHTAEIPLGPLTLDLQVSAVHNEDGEYIGTIVNWEDITEKKAAESEAGKVQNMMESMPVNVLLCDSDLCVVYANALSIKTLKSIKDQLDIKVDNLMGTCIDDFHADPSYQRGIISNHKSMLPKTALIKIGQEDVDLQVDAVYDNDGEFIGAMATWMVVTEQKRLEREQVEAQEREQAQAEELRTRVDTLLEVVNAAADGDFNREVTVKGDDPVGQMGHSLERLMSETRTKVSSILEVVQAAGAGDLTSEVKVRGNDPIGQVGEGLASFLENFRQNIGDIAGNAQSLAGSSEELTAVSQQMSANSEETTTQAQVVADATKKVNENVQTVASGTEEMSSSIKEIAKNASRAAEVANEAVQVADNTNETISKLGESSNEIGQVIKVITSIAQQTNLLALNATIEAARAGDAGKGFAVVANEVKELAKETAKATEDISNKIEAIQTDTKDSVDAIGKIGEIIGQINDIQGTIASAVEEQSATTNEMARNVDDANRGTSDITENIDSVAKAAQDTTRGATDVEKSASDLTKMAADLQTMVGNFKY